MLLLVAAWARFIENRRSRARGVANFFFLRSLSGESAAFEQTRAALQPQPRFFALQRGASFFALLRWPLGAPVGARRRDFF